MEKGNPKVINAWATFDLANSVYNLVITATIFPIYYKLATTFTDPVTGEKSSDVTLFGITLKNTTMYDYALAFAFLIVAGLSPLLSGIADYGGNKKRFLQFFTYLGGSSCLLMYFFDSTNIGFGVMLAIFACIGYAGGLVFYNAYLPEIAEEKDHDRVSARGFAMGYFGSAFLLIANLALVMTRETGEERMEMMRWSFVTVGIWWIAWAQIPFTILKNNPARKKAAGNRLTKGYQEIRKVWRELKHDKKLVRFLPAFFIYSMGVQTVMLVANHFGADEIKMEPAQLITTILIIQFVAMGGAFLFSYASKRRGNLPTLKAATVIWAAICIGTYLFVRTPVHFYIVAAFVGLVMGGTQSLSRSTYSKMLPETEDNSSYFSFYDVAEKLSIVCGMATFGFINEISPSMREPIMALIVFFVLGFALLLRVPKDAKELAPAVEGGITQGTKA
jgi:MFS transporter, UMF1 family